MHLRTGKDFTDASLVSTTLAMHALPVLLTPVMHALPETSTLAELEIFIGWC
jgi:hypothetical protein